ncbi:hypothetical protein N7528_003962 [Penicillium herquei]|nr:hypothetical protein N7528_003962 [Penicillium herquei]
MKLMTEDEGSEVLLGYMRRSDANDQSTKELAKQISRLVQGLPLLLSGLAGHIVDTQGSLSETLSDLNESSDDADHILTNIPPDSATFYYDRPVEMAFNVSLKKIPTTSMTVLRIMSMLSPDCIMEDMLVNQIPKVLGPSKHQDKSRFKLDIRQHLVTRHLIQYHKQDEQNGGARYYSLHRQLQSKVLRDLESDTHLRQQTFEKAVVIIQSDFPKLSDFMVPSYAGWSGYEMYIAHVVRLEQIFRRTGAMSSQVPINGSLQWAEILASAGYYLYETRLLRSSLAVTQAAAQVCEALLKSSPSQYTVYSDCEHGEEDIIQLQATSWTIHWGCLFRRGLDSRQQALETIRRVIRLREAHAELTLPSSKRTKSQALLSNAYHDYACQLVDLGKYNEADEYLQRSITVKNELKAEQSLPTFEFASSKAVLTDVLLGKNRPYEALEQIQEALDMMAKDDNASPADFAFLYARCLIQVGRLEEALNILKNRYLHAVNLHGEMSIMARDLSYGICLTQYRLGQFDEAR